MRTDTDKRRDDSHDKDPDPIEELLLVAFPNPEREGCPDPTVIASYGNQQIATESVWDHIFHCSPCFAEFKLVRDTRWKREALQARRRKKLQLFGATSAVLVIFLLVSAVVAHSRKPQIAFSAQAKLLATIDLSQFTVVRGGDHEQKKQVRPPAISQRTTELELLLPPFSGDGHYLVALLRSRKDQSALAQGTGVATGDDTHLSIRVRMDLSRVHPGEYLLATWHDSDKALYFYPLQVTE